MEKVVSVKNLVFSYEDNIVLDNINLDIYKEEFVAFVGPNGSGKSTLMKLMLGLLTSDRGTVELLGQPVEKFDNLSFIGYVSQEVKSFNKSFPATVREIVAANLYSQMGFLKLLDSKKEEKIERALSMVNMGSYKNRQLGNLSGGQQQRVFLARTLVNEPDVIFLDEPLVGVDGSAQKSFFRLINSLNRRLGITLVMISHDIHVVSSEASRVVCFSGGNIFVHEADNFDSYSYQHQVKKENKLIPDHEHKGGQG